MRVRLRAVPVLYPSRRRPQSSPARGPHAAERREYVMTTVRARARERRAATSILHGPRRGSAKHSWSAIERESGREARPASGDETPPGRSAVRCDMIQAAPGLPGDGADDLVRRTSRCTSRWPPGCAKGRARVTVVFGRGLLGIASPACRRPDSYQRARTLAARCRFGDRIVTTSHGAGGEARAARPLRRAPPGEASVGGAPRNWRLNVGDDPRVEIVPLDGRTQFRAAVERYAAAVHRASGGVRPHRLRQLPRHGRSAASPDALAHDRDFEQAGFPLPHCCGDGQPA